MKRSPMPRRKTRLRQRNPARAARAFARNFGPKAEWIRGLPCLVRGCRRRSEACHAQARGMGGAKGDASVLVPLCRRHHGEAGELRTGERQAFTARYGLDLMAEAWRLEQEWQKIVVDGTYLPVRDSWS